MILNPTAFFSRDREFFNYYIGFDPPPLYTCQKWVNIGSTHPKIGSKMAKMPCFQNPKAFRGLGYMPPNFRAVFFTIKANFCSAQNFELGPHFGKIRFSKKSWILPVGRLLAGFQQLYPPTDFFFFLKIHTFF